MLSPPVGGVVTAQEPPGSWRCCCGCCLVTTGAKIIAWLDIISALISIIAAILYGTGAVHHDGPKWTFWLRTVAEAIILLVAILVLVGLAKRAAPFLIPWLVLALIKFVLFILAVLVAVLIATGVFAGVVQEHKKRSREELEFWETMGVDAAAANETQSGPWYSRDSGALGYINVVPTFTGAFVAGTLAYIILSICLLAVMGYLIHVVYRAYQYLKFLDQGHPGAIYPQPPYLQNPQGHKIQLPPVREAEMSQYARGPGMGPNMAGYGMEPGQRRY